MQTKELGRSGLHVSRICFGGNVFGWTIDEPTSFALLDAFVDAGFNFIDTADVYANWAPGNSGGESETIIGKWLQRSGQRDRVIIATKAGLEFRGKKGLSRAHILESIEGLLQRLQTDYIDLYQAHRDDESTPLEETLSTFAELIRAGKVRAIGASNYTAPRLKAAIEVSHKLAVPRFESLQPHYNLAERGKFEGDLEQLCLDADLGVIPYYSLASGFLTGKYRSEADLGKSARGSSAKKYLNDRGRQLLSALDSVAERHRATPAQVALAWLIARPSITAPIVSATNVDQLQEILASADLRLDTQDLAELDPVSAAA
jgi:aryl-alcohol dehydrogenase-like predicted oxidoreductase